MAYSSSLGTHNTYTQVSSECGLVPFFCFISVLVISFRRMRRLSKEGRGRPELQEASAMAHAIFLALAGYSGSVLFHHVAYSGYLTQITALATALFAAAEPMLARQSAPEPAQPSPVPIPGRRPWVRAYGR
jgi:O-antigen ligase